MKTMSKIYWQPIVEISWISPLSVLCTSDGTDDPLGADPWEDARAPQKTPLF